MSEYNWFILILAIAASFLSYRQGNYRGIALAVAVLASYALSTAYHRSGLPAGALAGALCDAAVCIGVYITYKRRWELGVYAVCLVMVMVNFLYWVEIITSNFWYNTSLEVCSSLVFVWIGGVPKLMEFLDHVGQSGKRGIRGFAAWAGVALRETRSKPPFTEKW